MTSFLFSTSIKLAGNPDNVTINTLQD